MKHGMLAGLAFSLLGGCLVQLPSKQQPIAEPYHSLLEACVKDDPSFSVLETDEMRLAALKEFYERSVKGDDVEKSPLEQLVVVSVEYQDEEKHKAGFLAHGYLMDDCGLVLTVYHLLQDGFKTPDHTITVIDQHKNVFPATYTELSDSGKDYAVLKADTQKPPHSHPLRFREPPPSTAIFYSRLFLYPADLLFGPRLHDRVHGKVVSPSDMLPAVIFDEILTDPFAISSSLFNIPSAYKGIHSKNSPYHLFSTATVKRGCSGDFLFEKDYTFAGIIKEFVYSTHRTKGLGVALKSTSFFDGVRDYLADLQVLKGAYPSPLALQQRETVAD